MDRQEQSEVWAMRSMMERLDSDIPSQYTCPVCGAKPRKPCVARGEIRKSHKARLPSPKVIVERWIEENYA